MSMSRKDSKGRVLRKGESQRKNDGRYIYQYTDSTGKRRVVYSNDLLELREKEKELVRNQLDGLESYCSGKTTLNYAFDRYISTKYDLKEHTRVNYKYMYNRGEFADYPQFADELKNLGNLLVSVQKAADEKGKAYAAMFADKDKEYQIWTGSGMTWGHTYSMAMCVLEECQWLRTKSVNSAEFFHGTIEMVEKGVLVCVGMGEGPTRPLDERVIHFVQKHTDQLFVFDTKDYEFPGISDKFRWLLSPVMLWAIYERAYTNLADVRKHTLDIRRYYRRLEY